MKKLLLGLGLLLSVTASANQYCKVVSISGLDRGQREAAINKVIRQEQDGPGLSILTDIKIDNGYVYLVFTDDK